MATWDIIRHYCDLSEEELEFMKTHVDHPINRFLAEVGHHASFDEFEWAFEEDVSWLSNLLSNVTDCLV